MRFYLTILLVSIALWVQGQNPGSEYFAKIPPRYVTRGVAPAQLFYFGRFSSPPSTWLKNSMELRLTIATIKVNAFSKIDFSAGVFAGLRVEQNTRYESSGARAEEKASYSFAAPTTSVAFNYGILFPYVLSLRTGVCYGWDNAKYKAEVSFKTTQASQDVALDREFNYEIKNVTGLVPFTSLELYRPFKIRSDRRKFGISISCLLWPTRTGKSTSLGYGLYWHL